MGGRKSGEGKASMKQRLDDLIHEMIEGGIRFPEAKREFEKRFLTRVIEREKGNLSRAARALHIHRNTLSKKLQEF
jgi:DNA-binding NtrC family response regulator